MMDILERFSYYWQMYISSDGIPGLGSAFLANSTRTDMATRMPVNFKFSIPKISLDAAGLVALADLKTTARRTALTGTASLLDSLVVCPGLHRVLDAKTLNGNEFPACAAMNTGYPFRVENPATVSYLQKVGRTGHLTTVRVSMPEPSGRLTSLVSKFYDVNGLKAAPTIAYFLAVSLTVVVIILLALLNDWWALFVVLSLCFARLINAVVIRSCATADWHGASEDGESDLMVLLSYDRWLRIQGSVNDVKAVTSGEWLREPNFAESSLVAFATLLVYLDAALAGNATQAGQVLLMVLLFGTAGILGLANHWTTSAKMKGRLIEVVCERKPYKRRRDLADGFIKLYDRDDWAVALGMIPGRESRNSVLEKAPAVM